MNRFFLKKIWRNSTNIKPTVVIFYLALLFLSTPLYSEIFWDGRFYGQTLSSFKDNSTTNIGTGILDLKLDARPTDFFRTRGELEYAYAYSENNPAIVSNNTDFFVINTFNTSFSRNDYEFTIGRFLPGWGRAKVFRPLDLFIPQTFYLNMLSHQGIDGVSAKYYISGLSSIEFLAIPSMDTGHITPYISTNSALSGQMNNSVAAINTEIHLGTFDNNFIFLHDSGSENNVLGFTCKGDAVVGLWSELYYGFNQKEKIDTFKTSLGADYSFAKYYFIAVEYFYDESGMPDYSNYSELMSLPRMTFGRQYLMFDFNIITYSEMNYGITYIGNLLDDSFMLYPYFRYEIFKNGYLGLSLYHFDGAGGREFSPGILGSYVLNTYLVAKFH